MQQALLIPWSPKWKSKTLQGFLNDTPTKSFQKQWKIYLLTHNKNLMGILCTKLEQLHHLSNQVTKLYINRIHNQKKSKSWIHSNSHFSSHTSTCNDICTLVHMQNVLIHQVDNIEGSLFSYLIDFCAFFFSFLPRLKPAWLKNIWILRKRGLYWIVRSTYFITQTNVYQV